MDDQRQIRLLQHAIAAYDNGAIIEAKDMAIEFINNITDFEAESMEWIRNQDIMDINPYCRPWKCPKCLKSQREATPYCPMCGVNLKQQNDKNAG